MKKILSKELNFSKQCILSILHVNIIVYMLLAMERTDNAISYFTSAAYIQVHFRLDFFMEENNMNPDQTAKGAV